MWNSDLILQQPREPRQLILLFHGAGDEPKSMQALGEHLAAAFPQALLVSVAAVDHADEGRGRQWYSTRGLNPAQRIERVAGALRPFYDAVSGWQQRSGVAPEATALIGFSQGGIMALEAAVHYPGLCGRVFSLAGRFAELPPSMSPTLSVHLLHGKEDPIVPCELTEQAEAALSALGVDVTASILPGLAHSIDADMAAEVVRLLQTHIPKYLWQLALSGQE